MTRIQAALVLSLALVASGFAACGGSPAQTSSAAGGGGATTQSSNAASTTGVGGLGVGGSNHGPYSDFPKDPILDPDAPPPANIAMLFGPEGSGSPSGGPCLAEPEIGTLFPNNWLRPRFRMTPTGTQNVFEIRIHSANELNDLIVYTTSSTWAMPRPMWLALTMNLQDSALTVTVRGATLSGSTLSDVPSKGTTGDVLIAPAAAAGAVVYWHTIPANNSGELKGFSPGDEGVTPVLASSQVQVKPGGQTVTCIGCHTSTPDGQYAAFKTLDGTPGGAMGSVVAKTVGAPPPFWSMASIQAMDASKFGIPSFSKAHWAAGDHVLVTSWGNDNAAKLAWFDLEANASGQGVAFDFLARNGDSRGAIMPSFSHDGTTIIYTSTDGSTDGRPTDVDTDLYTVPYANKLGGAATPVPGASDPSFNEYYPALSPDDRFIAFNRISKGDDTYDQPNGEVFVIPSAGGTATRLLANDPIACSGAKSPGVTNSWPKWAPQAVTVGARTYYWLIFSSRRAGSLPQLYITGLVEEGSTLTTFPALYLWNQPADEANHTPAWDVFDIPQEPPK